MEKQFVHLHVHSHYSLLDGLATPSQLAKKAKADGMPALALTDHGVLYGAVDFYQQCLKQEIKPIIGIEAYLAPNGRLNKRAGVDDRRHHVILLAENDQGYKNLLKLCTAAWLEGFYYKPRIDWELLETHKEGLIVLSACLNGEVPSALKNGAYDAAKVIAQKYLETFGSDHFYLELQNHVGSPELKQVNQGMIEIANELGIELVATNDVHYLNSEDTLPHDVLLCLGLKRKVAETGRMNMTHLDLSLKTTDEMYRLFVDYPESALTNTVKIAARCRVTLPLGEIQLPHYPLPAGQTDLEALQALCMAGLEKRYPNQEITAEMRERLDYEMGVIEKTGFASYFLIVQDFVNWAKEQGIVVGPGRGSAAGSFIAYLLGITNIDPLKYDLLFERFLNPERISMPDIDLDFADTRRDEVIAYVAEKYGREHVAQIITFGTMAARAAIRDVGRVLDMSYNYCDQVAKLIPMFTDLTEAMETVPELKDVYVTADGKKLLDMARKVEGLARHTSTHACGVVITREPLVERVPVQYAGTDDQSLVTQYSLKPIEDLGLLKMDFLGLKNLTIIEDTLKVMEKTRGQKIEIDNIPLDDQNTFRLLSSGLTTSVFQLESSGMKRYLKQLRPSTLEDIIAMVALYRPGPMEYIPDYIAGKHGRKTTGYLHPVLEPILNKTYGVAIYQEQVMQIARDLAGFTLGEADILRKAVGKKIVSLLQEQKDKFIAGCLKQGVDRRIAEEVFAFIEPFAGYGFNRSHAACYALIAYQTAYLKANFTPEFMASSLTAEQGNTERVAFLVHECKELGIEVLPPDINESYSTFTVVASSLTSDKPRIRFGLLAIKNVGENLVRAVIAERKTNGHFRDLEDFLSRVHHKDLNKKSLESLIMCGALDLWGERNLMLANIELLLQFARQAGSDDHGQESLFAGHASVAAKLRLNEKIDQPASQAQQLIWEKSLLGLYVTEHPWRPFAEALKGKIYPCHELAQLADQNVVVGGMLGVGKKIVTKKGAVMLFAPLEDTGGSTEIIVFPKIYQETKDLWREDTPVVITGKVSDKDGEIKVICDKIKVVNLAELPVVNNHDLQVSDKQTVNQPINSASKQVIINLPAVLQPGFLEELKNILATMSGEHRVLLAMGEGSSHQKISTNFSIAYSDSIKQQIERLTGVNSVTY